MLNEFELKEKLQSIAQNEFRLSENDELSKIIPSMLNHIGSTDSELRDDLIYSAFGTWIGDRVLDAGQLPDLLPIILDEQHLLFGLGEQETDSVFTRSFSVLLLPLLLIFHRSQPLFSAPEIHQIKKQLFYYLENEHDRRGFVHGKGWAHAIAHAADALDDLAQCTELEAPDLAELLGAIRKAVCIGTAHYAHLEEERLATAVIAVLKRDVFADEEIQQWIDSFSDLTLQVNSVPERHVIRANVKSFLQSLYFRLHWEGMTNRFDTAINDALRKINPFASQASA
jgi:hypothetical protein